LEQLREAAAKISDEDLRTSLQEGEEERYYLFAAGVAR
jgi:hypothetical protein